MARWRSGRGTLTGRTPACYKLRVGEPLRVGVMGAGSIGCYVGGKLLAARAADVLLVGRERLQKKITVHGLRVRGVEGDGEVPPDRVRYETDPASLAACEVVLVCVKSAQTSEVAEQLASILPTEALVVSLQNGLRNAEMLGEHIDPSRVVPAIVGFNVVSVGDGVFHSGLSGPLVLEDRSGTLFGRTIAALRRTGLPVETPVDIRPEQHTKLLVNLNNAVSALSGAPTRSLLLTPGYRRAVAAIVQEGVDVIRASGVRPAPLRGVPVGLMPKVLRLPTPLVRLVTRAQMKVDPQARSSMWEDLTRGRPTEVDYLNGEIVRLAERVGAAAPLNRRVVELVREAERSGSGSPGLSPEALWDALTR